MSILDSYQVQYAIEMSKLQNLHDLRYLRLLSRAGWYHRPVPACCCGQHLPHLAKDKLLLLIEGKIFAREIHPKWAKINERVSIDLRDFAVESEQVYVERRKTVHDLQFVSQPSASNTPRILKLQQSITHDINDNSVDVFAEYCFLPYTKKPVVNKVNSVPLSFMDGKAFKENDQFSI